ncbi:GNAT family N-acetyltransferase [Oleomonas cavernae]|uniref:GNAT family N-acetyltransferase n=1 Tax=Oleomonas cavernae TaxID=2320859 RepID=UPI001F4138F9|nr:GNAT family N-acetyltransferase [Oleomonas cavernae]
MSFADASLVIEPLRQDHDREAFACGVESLDRYIKTQAGQDIRRGIARVFVAATVERPTTILGYYTLSATSVAAAELPPAIARRLPRYPIPAALIGRLAVAQATAGQGLGKVVLADAIKRTIAAAETLAVAVIVVDPIDDRAASFYAAFGFAELQAAPRHMVLALSIK